MICSQNVYNSIEYLIVDNMISIASLGLCNNIYDDQYCKSIQVIRHLLGTETARQGNQKP